MTSFKHVVSHIVCRGEACLAPTVILLLFLLPITAHAEDIFVAFDLDERERTLVLHVPDELEESRVIPLLIVLHGATMTGEAMQQVADFDAIADEEGFIVAYPNAIGGYWNNLPSADDNIRADDVAFVETIISAVGERFPIDPNRVFVVGFSNGGVMAYRLACDAGDSIAGIGIVIANMIDWQADNCLEGTPVPVMIVNGTADTIFPWSGQVIFDPYQIGFSSAQTAMFWAIRNGCRSANTDVMESDDVRVLLQHYGDCEAEVVLYGILGGEHRWFPEPQINIFSEDGGDLNLSELLWTFFVQQIATENDEID